MASLKEQLAKNAPEQKSEAARQLINGPYESKRLTVRIPMSTYVQAEKLGKVMGNSVTGIINTALLLYIHNNKSLIE